MRAFKIWNKDRTSSFNLSGLNVITTNVAGLGNKFTNDLYDGRIKKHLISQTNSFEQISLTVNFGVHSNAYQKYREFMNFIQANGRNILVIEYYTPGASRFVDVVLSGSTKSQKTNFNVLVETVSFDRLTPYYILQRRTGTSVLVSNRYLENVVPRLELKNNLYPTGTKIRVKSKNEGMPDITGKEYLGNGIYKLQTTTGVTLTYNILTGIYNMNGLVTNTQDFWIYKDLNMNGIFTISIDFLNKVPGTLLFMTRDLLLNYFSYYGDFYVNTQQNGFNDLFVFLTSGQNINVDFKLQIEKAGNALELDRPIDELNGHTLREVFENYKPFIPHLNQALDLGNNNFRIPETVYDGGQLRLDMSSSSEFPNGKYYFRFGANNNNNNTSVTTVTGYDITGNGWGLRLTTPPNSANQYSSIINFNRAGLSNPDFARILLTNNLQPEYDILNPILINLDTLGLGNLNKNQLDDLYNQYQTLKETPTSYSKPITETIEIELNESILSNQTLVIDSENKTVTLNGANAYQITNKDKSTFLNLPEGDYLVECDTPIAVEYKRWVID